MAVTGQFLMSVDMTPELDDKPMTNDQGPASLEQEPGL
jgi:hypothetical protein